MDDPRFLKRVRKTCRGIRQSKDPEVAAQTHKQQLAEFGKKMSPNIQKTYGERYNVSFT